MSIKNKSVTSTVNMSLFSSVSSATTSSIGTTVATVTGVSLVVAGAAVGTVVATYPKAEESESRFFNADYVPEYYTIQLSETLPSDQHFKGIDIALGDLEAKLKLPTSGDVSYVPETDDVEGHLRALDDRSSGSIVLDLPQSVFYSPVTDINDLGSHLEGISSTFEIQEGVLQDLETRLGTYPTADYGSTTVVNNSNSASDHFSAIDASIDDLRDDIDALVNAGALGILPTPIVYANSTYNGAAVDLNDDAGTHLNAIDVALGAFDTSITNLNSQYSSLDTLLGLSVTTIGAPLPTAPLSYGSPADNISSHFTTIDSFFTTQTALLSSVDTKLGTVPANTALHYSATGTSVSDYLIDLSAYVGDLSAVSPSNYSPATDTVEDHLSAIDAAIGAIPSTGTLPTVDYTTGSNAAGDLNSHLTKVDDGLNLIDGKIGTLPSPPQGYNPGLSTLTSVADHLSAISTHVGPVTTAQAGMKYIQDVTVDTYGRVTAITPVPQTTVSTYGRTGDYVFESFVVDEFVGVPHLVLDGGTYSSSVSVDMGTKPCKLPAVDPTGVGSPQNGMVVFHNNVVRVYSQGVWETLQFV